MNKAKPGKSKGEFCDFGNDFTLLTAMERRNVLKTAKTYWKLLRDNGALRANGGESGGRGSKAAAANGGGGRR